MALTIQELLNGSATWAKNGNVADMGKTNYEAGWAFLGDNPPTAEDFNFIQQITDKRFQYLFLELLKRASLESPALTGVPTAPTASQATNNTQIATTAFVKSAIAALVGSAPAALDTLAELATALGNDSNLKQVLLAEIGNKASKSEFTSFLDLFIGVPIAIPTVTLPVINIPGYTVMTLDGGRFSTSMYPKLAKVYPTGVKPDLRGEFIRGWSNGRGVDNGRGILTAQNDDIKLHSHQFQVQENTNKQGRIVNIDRISAHNAAAKDNNSSIFVNGLNPPIVGKEPWGDESVQIAATGGSETRPRNVAYQYICLAA